MERISSYELLNNLLPGAVYIVGVEFFTDFDILTGSVFNDAVMCYLVGLIIGRIGSLVVEELLKKVRRGKWLGRVDYSEYVSAERKDKDGKLKLLSMTNNAYRAFAAAMICVLMTVVLDLFWSFISETGFGKQIIVVLILIAMVVLLCFSYKKQTGYVASRAKTMNSKKDTKRG